MYFDVNGQSAFASTGGKPFDPTLPVVVFLHGSGLDHTFWALHSRFFAFRRYAVLCPDLPAHSLSSGEPLVSIEAMADWLHAALEALGAERLSLVAHSMGSLVALEFGARFPDRLRSLSLIASGLSTPVNPALIESAERDSKAAIAMMLGWGFGGAGHLHQGPIPGNSMLAGGRKVMSGNVPAALTADLKACDAYANGKAAAAAIRTPVQVIQAGRDRMAPRAAAQELIDHLPTPETHWIAESGHMIPLEAPDRCRLLLKDFIFAHNPSH